MFCSWDDKTLPTTWNFPPIYPETAETCPTYFCEMFVILSLRDRLICFCRSSWKKIACLHYGFEYFPHSATSAQLFQNSSSHTVCSSLELFSTINNLRIFWRIKIHRVSADMFCSWEVIFMRNFELRFPQELLQLPGFLVHAVVEYLFRKEFLVVWKQSPCCCFL